MSFFFFCYTNYVILCHHKFINKNKNKQKFGRHVPKNVSKQGKGIKEYVCLNFVEGATYEL